MLPGKDKVAIWKVYEDVNGIKGGLEPVFTVKPIVNPVTKSAPPVVDTPTPPKNDDTPIIDIIDSAVNGKKNVVRTGVKVGLGNSSAVVSRAAGEFSRDFSWQAGLYQRYNLNRKLYVQAEALFHRQRYSRSTFSFDERYTHNQLRGQVIGGWKPIGLGLYLSLIHI